MQFQQKVIEGYKNVFLNQTIESLGMADLFHFVVGTLQLYASYILHYVLYWYLMQFQQKVIEGYKNMFLNQTIESLGMADLDYSGVGTLQLYASYILHYVLYCTRIWSLMLERWNGKGFIVEF